MSVSIASKTTYRSLKADKSLTLHKTVNSIGSQLLGSLLWPLNVNDLDHIWMIKHSHDANLTKYAFGIFKNVENVENTLHRDMLTCLMVVCKRHCAVAALSEQLFELKTLVKLPCAKIVEWALSAAAVSVLLP